MKKREEREKDTSIPYNFGISEANLKFEIPVCLSVVWGKHEFFRRLLEFEV